MTYKTHIALAVAAALPLANYLSLEKSDMFFYMGVVAFGALFPDLDEEGSYLSRRLPVFPMFFKLFGVEHRGFTHKAIAVLALLIGMGSLYFFDNEFWEHYLVYLFFVYGYVLHLIGDMFTKGGIRDFFYPIGNVHAVVLPRDYRFYTGSFIEHIVFFALIVVVWKELSFFWGILDAQKVF